MSVAGGTQVSIDCYVNGQPVGKTSIWDHLTAGGYISDSLLRTGADGPVVPVCTTTQIDTFRTLNQANIQSGPTPSSSVISAVPRGGTVTIVCFSNGDSVGGTTLWDFVSGTGFISDSAVITGTNSTVVTQCDPNANQKAAVAVRGFEAAEWAKANYMFSGPLGDDCTWFVSSALEEGGLPTTALWTYNSSNSSILAGHHFGNPGATLDWSNANDFVSYMTSPSTGIATKTLINWSDNTADHAQLGDVIAYFWNDLPKGQNEIIEHVAIVTGFTSTGYPTVTQQTPGQTGRYWSWSLESSKWIQAAHPGAKAYLIHFVK